MRCACLLLAVWACWSLGGAAGGDQVNLVDAASNIRVVVGNRASGAEQQVAQVLADRVARRSGAACSVIPEEKAAGAAADLFIYLGLPANHDALAALCLRHGLATPTARDPGPEGFAVRTAREGDQPVVLAAGVDKRGVLYAAGEIARLITYGAGSIAVAQADVRTAPAYRLRGSSAGDRVKKIELAFAGANLFYSGGEEFTWAKSFDLLTKPGLEVRPNQLWKPYPPEWQAVAEQGYVCPSIPEARKALIEQWAEAFRPGSESPESARWSQDHDVLRFASGDPGGCRCPKCRPWGKTYILLCEELAQIWLRYHPHSEVQITNQDLDNQGDQAIFDYLNEQPRTWLSAISYGPGGSAMSPYFRRELREDLFVYPGHGPVNRYLREILNNLPRHQHICFFSDITHWISSQYQLPNPEPHLVAVYGRRTFHTRPRQLYAIFQAIMPFSEGDIVYSEGAYDELNQYLWNRLLWDPNRPLEDVIMQYCRLYFGAASAPEMMEAIFQLERNLQTPLAANLGVDRFYTLVKSAGWNMPPHLMRDDLRWRLYMQKAALDKYVQLQLRLQVDVRHRTLQAVQRALAGDGDAAAAILDEPRETPDMAALRAEAERLAQEMADLDPALGGRFILLPEPPDERLEDWQRRKYRLNLDFVGLEWMRREIERARNAEGAERLRLLREMVSYDDPGPGGFYDDLGSLEGSPHLVTGETVDASRWLDPENRFSANTIAYTLGKARGVTLRYEGLDPNARHKVRLTLVAPRRTQGRWSGQPAQHVVANGHYLVRDLQVPLFTARQFEYDIPPEATRLGALDLWLESPNQGATVLSEVWLIRK